MAIVTHRAAGVEVRFDLPDQPAGAQSFFVLGIRKSGSSIFNSIVHALANHNGVPFLDVGGAFFDANVRVPDWIADPALAKVLRPGVAYGGFRDFPTGLAAAPLFRDGLKVLMVRDPRDALVSEYFSNAYSHALPSGDATTGEAAHMLEQRNAALHSDVEAYVGRQSAALLGTLAPFTALPEDPRLLVLRYEDVILDKPTLIRRVAAHFGWTLNEQLITNILSWADVRPDVENPQAFIRKVTPGDHREKLSPAMIARLDAQFAPFMARYGYR